MKTRILLTALLVTSLTTLPIAHPILANSESGEELTEPQDSYPKQHWYEIIFQTKDGSVKYYNPMWVTKTTNGNGSFDFSYVDIAKNETISWDDGKLGLDFLVSLLPEGYTFVDSKTNLENVTLKDFKPYSEDDPNYQSTIYQGSYCKTIEIQKAKIQEVSFTNVKSLQDGIPVFFECASDFNDYLNIYYHKVPLGTTTFIKEIADSKYNEALLKNVIMDSIRKNTHYKTEPLITPVTSQSIVSNLIAYKSGPNYSEDLFYTKKGRLILEDANMAPHLKELKLESQEAENFLVKENEKVIPVIDENQIESLKDKLQEGVVSGEYNYDFEINLKNSIVLIENDSYQFSLDLRAFLNGNSKIKLILSGLKSYLESLLPSPLAEISPKVTEMIEMKSLDSSFITLENAFLEPLEVEIQVNDFFVGNQFNQEKALTALKDKIREKSEYSSIVEKVDLSSHIKALEDLKLQSSSFPMTLGNIVEIKVTPTEEAASPTLSKPSSSKPKPSTSPSEETKPSPLGTVGKKTLYRFYNKLTGEHFFTSDEKERDTLLKEDAWSNEGHGWTTPEFSNYPIYRLCNPNNGDHHYTMDKNEYDTLQNTYGWIGEGVGLYSAGEEDKSIVLLHRLYNPNATGAGSHHYTADENERNELVKLGWSYEGTAWYGLTDSEF